MLYAISLNSYMRKILSQIAGLFARKPVHVPEQIPGLPVINNAPYGLPQSKRNLQILTRTAYISGYDAASKIPEYVIWTLLPENTLGCVPRSNAFVTDAAIVNGATPQDYNHSGFDKGHMAPDEDQAWNTDVERHSFLMSNMTPQAPSLNRGIWKLLELSFHGWTNQLNRPFTAISGSVYDTTDKKIGNAVTVPHAFYKVVIDSETKQYAAWYFPHITPYPDLGNDLTKFRKRLTDIEKECNITIKLPDGAQEILVGHEWLADFTKLEQAKRDKCHGVQKS